MCTKLYPEKIKLSLKMRVDCGQTIKIEKKDVTSVGRIWTTVILFSLFVKINNSLHPHFRNLQIKKAFYMTTSQGLIHFKRSKHRKFGDYQNILLVYNKLIMTNVKYVKFCLQYNRSVDALPLTLYGAIDIHFLLPCFEGH